MSNRALIGRSLSCVGVRASAAFGYMRGATKRTRDAGHPSRVTRSAYASLVLLVEPKGVELNII